MKKKLYLFTRKSQWTFLSHRGLILTLFIAFAFPAFAQDIKVSGIIRDQNGEALPGTSVLVKGTTIGTASDVNGYYSLMAPSNGILSVSYTGFMVTEISVNGVSALDIIMNQTISELDEVVVVSYGTQKKRDVTGSITCSKYKCR